MYETPKLNRVGEAEEIILGASPSGDDLDGNFIAFPPLFGPDDPWGQH